MEPRVEYGVRREFGGVPIFGRVGAHAVNTFGNASAAYVTDRVLRGRFLAYIAGFEILWCARLTVSSVFCARGALDRALDNVRTVHGRVYWVRRRSPMRLVLNVVHPCVLGTIYSLLRVFTGCWCTDSPSAVVRGESVLCAYANYGVSAT